MDNFLRRIEMTELAINGGSKVRKTPFPARNLLGEEERAALNALIDSALATGRPISYNGPAEKEYERNFAEWMGGGFADGVNSGTNALFCAIGALNIDALSEIIVPPITDPGGCMPVLFAGCVPVVADADPRTFNASAEGIASRITERTRAIVVAHIAGEPADMDPIMELAARHNLYVIEDCSQCHGALYKGRKVGSIGHIAAFSTMSGKHHCTGGQGGVVFTKDENLHIEGRRFADRGKTFLPNPPYNVRAGLNCNLDDVAATIGACQLKKLPGMLERRWRNGEMLKQALQDNPAVKVGWQVPDSRCVYWFLRLTIDTSVLKCDKKAFCDALEAEGMPVLADYAHIPCKGQWFIDQRVFGNTGYPWQCPAYKGERHPVYDMRNAEEAVANNFIIFAHEKYSDADMKDIIDAIDKVTEYYL